MQKDPFRSVSGWTTNEALKFRNPPEGEWVASSTPGEWEQTPAPPRNACEQVVRIFLVEFPVIPILVVASLVEGVARLAIGLIAFVPAFGVQILLQQFGASLPGAVGNTLECCIEGGGDSLKNTVAGVYFAILNITRYNQTVCSAEIECPQIC